MIAPTKNTTSPVILFAVTALGLIAGYFYYSQALQDQTPPIASVDISVDENLAKLKDLKFDFSGLDNLTFKNLKIFGDSPVLPGATGRTDIFAPF